MPQTNERCPHILTMQMLREESTASANEVCVPISFGCPAGMIGTIISLLAACTCPSSAMCLYFLKLFCVLFADDIL